MSCEKVGAHLH